MDTSTATSKPAVILDLPLPWLARLFQHVTSGPGGLARAAVLSQTCKFLHKLSDSSAITYCDVQHSRIITSSGDPMFHWITKRLGRIDGLTIVIDLRHLYTTPRFQALHAGPDFEQLGVEDPLQQLHSIPNTLVKTKTHMGTIDRFMSQRLRRHGHLIESIDAEVSGQMQGLLLQEACESVAACRSICLTVYPGLGGAVSLNSLTSLRESLVSLTLSKNSQQFNPPVEGWVNISSFRRLTKLMLNNYQLTSEDPWAPLAALSSLQYLTLSRVAAHGDGTSLSALARLTYLELGSRPDAGDEALGLGVPVGGGVAAAPPLFRLSSLQPLSALQKLEELSLYGYALTATSLAGLAGLSSLKNLVLSHCKELVSLEGTSTALTYLDISFVPFLTGLCALRSLVQLQHLELKCCGVTSLTQLATGLSSLTCLQISEDYTRAGIFGNDGADVVSDAALISLGGVEGLSSSLQVLVLDHLMELKSIVGVERLHALKELQLDHCGVTSLQPLAELRAEGFESLAICDCSNVQEEVLEMPHIRDRIEFSIGGSNIREVVFAGGRKSELCVDPPTY